MSSAIVLLGCSSTSGPKGFGSSGASGTDASGVVIEAGADNDADAASPPVSDSAGVSTCTSSDLSSLVGSSCASCVANSCASMLQACTTDCAGCATSLIAGCASCMTACAGGEAGAPQPSTDASSATSGDAGGDPCMTLTSCSGCTFVGVTMPAMQAPCMMAVAVDSTSACQTFLSGVQAAGFCK